METNIITITREFGSMGRPIAKLVAEKMGYEYLDRDIIDATVKKTGIPIEEFLDMDEKPLTAYDKMIYPLGIGDAVKQDKIFEAEKEAILELSSKQNCVIVGRCSDYILHKAKRPNLFSIHIYAPVHIRKNFGMQELGILPDKIDDYIVRVDSGRSEFYKRHTGVSFSSQRYRDVMINSEYLTKDQIAEAICTMAKFRFSESK